MVHSSSSSDPYLQQQLAGRYQLTALLGKGAMGRVYLAEDDLLGQVAVAVKLLSRPLLDDLARARFEREAKACAYLGQKSLHIVRVNDYGVTPEDVPFYVMEYLPGFTLRQLLLEKGSLPLSRCLTLARQMSLGLKVAHEGMVIEGKPQRVIHRDLKPANVMIVADESMGEIVKIVDFGVAKLLSEGGPATMTQAFLGTLAYASPEQLAGQALDHRSDIYSFGVMLYQMLAGELPILPETDSFPGWYQAHQRRSPLPVAAALPTLPLPETLKRLILSCLAKDPAARPQSMDEIAHKLQDLQTSLAAGAATGLGGGLGVLDPGDWRGSNPQASPLQVVPTLPDGGQTAVTQHLVTPLPNEVGAAPWRASLLGGQLVTWWQAQAWSGGWVKQPWVKRGGVAIATGVLLLGLGLWWRGQRSQGQYAQALQAGQTAFAQGEYDAAATHFEQALAAQPGDPWATAWLASVAQAQAGEPANAPGDLDAEADPAADSGVSPNLPAGLPRTFPVGTPQVSVRDELGPPKESGQGYWPNTVYDAYEVVADQIDFGLIYDRATLTLRQTEVAITDEVSDEVGLALLGQMLQTEVPPELAEALQAVRRGGERGFNFRHEALQGIIERNPQGRVYVATWEPGLHSQGGSLEESDTGVPVSGAPVSGAPVGNTSGGSSPQELRTADDWLRLLGNELIQSVVIPAVTGDRPTNQPPARPDQQRDQRGRGPAQRRP